MSFYVYETQTVPAQKCERCDGEIDDKDYELCTPCIHAMIMPGYSAPFESDELNELIRRANGE